MKDAPVILADTSPGSWQFPNGGEHRTRQIHELIGSAGIEIRPMDPPAPLSNPRKYLLGLKYWLRHGQAHGSPLRLIRHHGAVTARLSSSLSHHDGAKVLVWENTHRNNQATPQLARHAGYAVMALPQNLESLVRNTGVIPASKTAARLTGEVLMLAGAESIHCISREEQWLLAGFGIAADYLPYYPPKAVADHLLEVRRRREGTEPQRWLILGSVGNPPTFAGVSELLHRLKLLPNGHQLPVDIAGYETERLREQAEGTEWRVHGGVDQQTLTELLVTAKAMLVHQISGAGALTRIPEMLMAGIPVVANAIAARSAFNWSGMYCHDSPRELGVLLHQNLAAPAAPRQPTNAEQRFIESLQQMIGRQRIG